MSEVGRLTRQQRKKNQKLSQKKDNKENKRFLTKKERKFYKKKVQDKLEKIGFVNSLIPYRTGVMKTFYRATEADDKKVSITPVKVEMVTYRNVFENMTKKILDRPVDEVEAFLLLAEKEYEPKK